MKKVFFVMLIAVAGLITSQKALAQSTFKVGIFDIDYMVQAMPGYPAVDSMVDVYNKDSLQAEYQFYVSEYQRLDSTYKLDSTAGKAKGVLNLEAQQRQQVAMNIAYWQQIAQQKSDQKRAQLAQPLYQQVFAAYSKVLAEQKFNLVLKPQSIERGTVATNIFKLVANELKMQLPQELDFNLTQTDQSTQKPATTAPKK